MQKAAHFRFVSHLFHHTPAHHRILSVSPNTHVVSVLNPPPLISFLSTAQSRLSLSFSIWSRSCVQHTETSCLVLVYYTELSVFLCRVVCLSLCSTQGRDTMFLYVVHTNETRWRTTETDDSVQYTRTR